MDAFFFFKNLINQKYLMTVIISYYFNLLDLSNEICTNYIYNLDIL